MNPAIETANETANTRANEAIAGTPTIEAPDVSKIEAPATTLTLPQAQTTVQPIEAFTSVTPEMLAEQRAINTAKTQQSETLGDIYSGLADIGTRGARTIEAERRAGIPELSTGLTEIENELAQKSLAFRRERERLETSTGLSAGQKNASLSATAREQNRELADLETIRAARSNTLTNAQNLVNRQIELEFGDKIAQVNALKFIYDENKDTLTKAEDKLFQQTIKREERAFAIEADKYKTFLEERNRYVQNAAQAGADNNTLKAIQSAQSLDDLYGMKGVQQYALSQSEKLDIEAKRQSIYSSAVATRLALAAAGDKTAIEELGFDPNKAKKEELDPTTRRQTEEKLSGSTELLKLLKDYRSIVEEKGYTLDSGLFGDTETVGKIDALRGQLVSAYRKAETLGTLDKGVLDLMKQLLGERPVSTLTGWGEDNQSMFANVSGAQARKLVSALDTVIETTEAKRAEAQLKLGIDPMSEALLSPEENAELNRLMGGETQEFDPNKYFE